MSQFVDLHCHYLPEVDDGARSLDESLALLDGLRRLGFCQVIATPHMRPGLFDNSAQSLRERFAVLEGSLDGRDQLPKTGLSAEHYFDDVVFSRIFSGQALPYPGGKAILLEFYDSDFPYSLDQRLADICRIGLMPVIAHPERYRPIAKDPEILERLLDLGATALLDVGALVDKYGRLATKTSRMLLERGCYQAACSDAHRPKDLVDVERGMAWIQKEYGAEEVQALLGSGPLALLAGSGQQRL